jgi:MtN3 and saliva related transmembrane protein
VLPYRGAMTVLGYFAGTLTTLSFLPQVVRSVRMRSASGLSWLWLVCFGCGISAWVVYGAMRGDPAIIASNAATLLAVLVLVWLRAVTGSEPLVVDAVTVLVEEHNDTDAEDLSA